MAYGALMFMPGAEFARTHLRTSWGDTAAFRPETILGSVFSVGWLILQQVGQVLALLAILNDLSWQERRRERGSLRDWLAAWRRLALTGTSARDRQSSQSEAVILGAS
jgi:hypothetical protein